MAFSGFGSTNNNNNTSGFGGFGSSTNNTFGSNTNTTSGGSLFGSNTATSGGFGGFGTNTNNANSNPFGGSKPAFGASTATTGGSGLFGGGTSTTGGFGSGSTFGAPANTTSTFGSNNSTSLFGQNKPATTGFGTSNTGGSLFGSGSGNTGGFGSNNNTTNPFGSSTTNTGFGNTANTNTGFGFGTSAANNSNNGTASPPFQAYTEKDTLQNQMQHFQSITFQQPYTNSSFEELRLQDYAQGRRYASSNGQAGSFGTSTGFGGFNASTTTNTGNSIFGNTANNNNTSGFGGSGSGFGAATNANPFGGNTNTSNSLFGSTQNKPAGGGLFGSNTATTTNTGFGSTNTGTSLFGNNSNNNNNAGGFGSNTNTNTGTSLFGNNQAQNKPFSGFGSANTNTGSVFGNNSGGNLFGNNTNAPSTTTGNSLFGTNNPQQPSTGFGSTNAGNSLFGGQNKPAGGGLFGSGANTNTGTSLFGGTNTQQQQSTPSGGPIMGGSLFGAPNQNKPAGTGLFGSSTAANTGGSLFGNNPQQNAGSSLFSQNANTGGSLFGGQNKPANSLFGGNTTNITGNSLFGSQNPQTQNSGNSLFGNPNQSQNNGNSLFGSMSQSQQPVQNQLHASLTASPYGNEQLFASLAAPSPPVGPLATPLNGAKPIPKKTQSLLSSVKVNSPIYSPRGGSLGRAGGYGFSYSTYGTPGSAFTSSTLTPGASSLLKPTGSFGSALTNRLNKSLSTSNLRGDANSGTPSLLRPGSFTHGSANGSLRRLKIDRTLRTDLWGPEPKQIEAAKEDAGPILRKKVSFTNETEQIEGPKPTAQNALVRTESNDDGSPTATSKPTNQTIHAKAPEMEQVKSLPTVPEDISTPRPSSAPPAKAPAAAELPTSTSNGDMGDYWTKPAMKDLKNMSRQQLQNVGNFVVGRTGVGRIEFGRVDLTNTILDDICGTIVQLSPRSATVYQDDHDKPSVGKALNVPSTIYLENSWPRSHGGKKAVTTRRGKDYDKHITRLRRVAGTHFLDYDPETGVWSFKVDHFTTYGLDDDDEDTEYADDSRINEDSSGLSEPPETPVDQENLSIGSMDAAEQEDTFYFKKMGRSEMSLPGNFGSEGMMLDEEVHCTDEADKDEHMTSSGLANADVEESFLSPGGPVQAPSPEAVERYNSTILDDIAAAEDDDNKMADVETALPGAYGTKNLLLRSILKPSTDLMMFASPEKFAADQWEDVLQRTMSPTKRDRQALKGMQQSIPQLPSADNATFDNPFKMSLLGKSALAESYLVEKSAKKPQENKSYANKSQAFRNAMDLMDSMYAQGQPSKKNTQADMKGFEYPYTKRRRISTSGDPHAHEWHNNFKPHFATSSGIVIHSAHGSAAHDSGVLTQALRPVISSRNNVRFVKFTRPQDVNPPSLQAQKAVTEIDCSTGFPFANLKCDNPLLYFQALGNEQNSQDFTLAVQERRIWTLCATLFDPLEISGRAQSYGIPENQVEMFAKRVQMDALRSFWADLTSEAVRGSLKSKKYGEERALVLLTNGDVEGACEQLMEAKDFKLATMISQLPAPEHSRAVIKRQIEVWRDRNDWTEMSEPIRALYSILAGQVCLVAGKNGANENRVAAFSISERFGLNWQQSFALRLLYGGHEDIGDAIASYVDDLNGPEPVKPTSVDREGVECNDVLYEILRLFVNKADLAALFDRRAVSGNVLNSRLTWQFATVLKASGVCNVPHDTFDSLTLDFAAELENAGKPVSSAWVLLHMHDSASRQRAVSDMLHRNGGRISTPGVRETLEDPTSDRGSFEHLTEDLHIPSTVVFSAKALWAQTGLRNPFLQTNFLLRAGEIEQAHQVLLSSVGPRCVIERDYEGLQATLDIFEGPNLRPTRWDLGGHMYGDFLRVVRAQKSGKVRERGVQTALQRLKRALAKREQEGVKVGLEERVAMTEMTKALVDFERMLDGPESRYQLRQSVQKLDAKMSGVEDEDGRVGGGNMELLMEYRRALGKVV